MGKERQANAAWGGLLEALGRKIKFENLAWPNLKRPKPLVPLRYNRYYLSISCILHILPKRFILDIWDDREPVVEDTTSLFYGGLPCTAS